MRLDPVYLALANVLGARSHVGARHSRIAPTARIDALIQGHVSVYGALTFLKAASSRGSDLVLDRTSIAGTTQTLGLSSCQLFASNIHNSVSTVVTNSQIGIDTTSFRREYQRVLLDLGIRALQR